MTVTLVAAVARNGVIGSSGAIPWQLPGEQKLFKTITVGHVLVMGRLTYESIGRPLPGRTTVVVTRQPGWWPADGHAAGPPDRPSGGLMVCGSVDEALTRAAALDDEIFVVGGAQIYAATLGRADQLRLTWVDADPDGDTFFPAVDWTQWGATSRDEYDGWAVVTYQRIDGA
ncbi:MAG TPA: dihydrofolate reductase [Nocardioidaceae bacterium]|nr:dihydrofolate reductase [Nocardioidaceae bacterium]